MITIILMAPILPGKSEAWRRFLQELKHSRRAEYEASRHHLGITAEWTWIVETIRSDIAIIAIEAEQPGPVIAHLAASELPFDRWFKEQLLALQGVELARPQATLYSDLVFEWQKPEIRGTAGEK